MDQPKKSVVLQFPDTGTKQAAWLGGMVDLVEKENEGLKLDAAQIAALEKEFMETFETFTVILSLSKK